MTWVRSHVSFQLDEDNFKLGARLPDTVELRVMEENEEGEVRIGERVTYVRTDPVAAGEVS